MRHNSQSMHSYSHVLDSISVHQFMAEGYEAVTLPLCITMASSQRFNHQSQVSPRGGGIAIMKIYTRSKFDVLDLHTGSNLVWISYYSDQSNYLRIFWFINIIIIIIISMQWVLIKVHI